MEAYKSGIIREDAKSTTIDATFSDVSMNNNNFGTTWGDACVIILER